MIQNEIRSVNNASTSNANLESKVLLVFLTAATSQSKVNSNLYTVLIVCRSKLSFEPIVNIVKQKRRKTFAQSYIQVILKHANCMKEKQTETLLIEGFQTGRERRIKFVREYFWSTSSCFLRSVMVDIESTVK